MTQLPTLSESTANLGMPMLFAGQAQKEFMINKALSILDAVIPSSVTDSLPAPPIDWVDGHVYRVTANATGDWAGMEDSIAVAVAGSWHFIAPLVGMLLFDQTADCMMFYRSGWQVAVEPETPAGGTVIDEEARAAILQLVAALRTLGLFQSG